MRNISLLLFAIALTIFVACSPRHCCDTRYTTLTADIDSLFGAMFADSEPGAIVLIAKGDTVIYEQGFGKARLDENTPIDSTTLFNICSISKQFSSVALLILQERGALSMSDTVSQYFPEFHSPLLRQITLRQMMSHTSGIPDTRPRTEQQWQEYLKKHKSIYANVNDYKHYALWKESTQYLDDLDSLAFTPGTQYEYQNPTFQLVLPIVERLTDSEFTSWMHTNIFAGAGMKHTVYFQPDVPMNNYAHGYIPAEGEAGTASRSKDGRWEESDYGEANFFPTKADGGLYTTSRDFLRWQRALYRNRIINEESLKQTVEPIVLTDEPDTYYGLGLYSYRREGFPLKIFHTGDNGGVYTYAAYFPGSEVSVIIFANRPDWDRPATVAAVDSILVAEKLI